MHSIERAWYGPEREGYAKGVLTLFIQTTVIIPQDIIQLIESLKSQVTRIYLGANRLFVTEFHDTEFLVTYCKKHNIEIVLETAIHSVPLLPPSLLTSATVIGTVYLNDYNPRNIHVKIDTYKRVFVGKLDQETSLYDLKKGMFKDDIEIKLPKELKQTSKKREN